MFRTIIPLVSLLVGCASANNGKPAETPLEAPQKEQETAETEVPQPQEETAPSPDREQAMKDCEECNGDWGKHGLAQVEGCICRTKDHGKPCKDGNDCQGTCLKKEKDPKKEDEFTCSEFVTTFGCYSYLPKGWSERSKEEKKQIPYVCLD